jgi:Zn-dependent protease
VLIAFNLIPIPPLDGSHVMKYLLPASWSFRYMQVSRYGIVVLILLLWLPQGKGILGAWMYPALYAGDKMVDTFDGFRLPSSRQWVR